MSLVRNAALALALLPPAAALAQPAPSAPPAVRIPGMSAAGNAALTKLSTKVDPAAQAQVRDEAAFRPQMAAVLNAPAIDLDKLAATLQRGRALATRGREIADDHLLTILRALSPADRAVMVRTILSAQPRPLPAPAPKK